MAIDKRNFAIQIITTLYPHCLSIVFLAVNNQIYFAHPSIRMKYIGLTILILISTSARGQVRTVGKIFVNGRELEIITHSPPYFEFNENDTTLTPTAKLYIDDFAKYYRDSLYIKRKFVIELIPGLTDNERKNNKDLGFKRLTTIINYLERNYGIDKSEFRVRYRETTTTDGCVGFLVKERKTKRLTRKERKKIKLEEDEYFRDE